MEFNKGKVVKKLLKVRKKFVKILAFLLLIENPTQLPLTG